MCDCNSGGWASPLQPVKPGSLIAVLIGGERKEGIVNENGFEIEGQTITPENIEGWKIRSSEGFMSNESPQTNNPIQTRR